MGLHSTGSDELIYIQTDKVIVTIKGKRRPSILNTSGNEDMSNLKVYCDDEFSIDIYGAQPSQAVIANVNGQSGLYTVIPMFYEQQRYELVIEGLGDRKVAFWHDNINIRECVTPTNRKGNILSGVINFGNEIGLSDLVIRIDGLSYLRIVLEVFPSKISYKKDYQAIIADVTKEVYGIVFDFLKKTYQGYKQCNTHSSSPVEFFAVINSIYHDFIKAADMILAQPHHILETTHEILPAHKIKRMDSRTIRWIEKHPDQTCRVNGNVSVERALAVKKQVTYDTQENRMIKFILLSTEKKLKNFKNNYLRLQRDADQEFIKQIDEMVLNINRRGKMSFLVDVGTYEASAGMSLVFSMAPGYRDLYKYYLMLLRGLAISGDVFNISIKDLALLYEYWCFIKLNSLMKKKYKLISQDVVRVQGNGLYISLVKGRGSKVRYKNLVGDTITLSYNPTLGEIPTVAQKPDNVLSLVKKSADDHDRQYEYVFDAKYKIAYPSDDGENEYHRYLGETPGPKEEDINSMHRYRDAIVYHSGAEPYERIMFGAYVLFPYGDEEEYRKHRFYESIKKVNIGGLPFLPSATELVEEMLNELISDSPESAFERATLPRGIEEKLKHVDWNKRDVLIGDLKNKNQLDVCLQNKFYYVPASQINTDSFPIHYVAIYQSKNIFGQYAGVSYYGEVTRCFRTSRDRIKEIHKNSDEIYYRFEIKEWKKLPKTIAAKEFAPGRKLTNMFLLEHVEEASALIIRSEEEFRLYAELKRAFKDAEFNDDRKEIGFGVDSKTRVSFENSRIVVYKDDHIVGNHAVTDFSHSPNAVFREVLAEVQKEES
jgi:uncharacterized protein